MLHVHRSAHAERLVQALADLLADPAGADPFLPEVVAVHSRGIERWLAQELSSRLGAADGRADGVATNLVFPFPATVVGWGVAHAVDGTPVDPWERRPTHDAWRPARLTWTLLDVLASGEAGDLGAFGAHVAGPRGQRRRLGALAHVADLFDRYAAHRPDMVLAWHAGEDLDATLEPLPVTDRWQPALWRAARARLGPSFAERVGDAVARFQGGLREVPGLPDRISLFGLTALPSTYVDVLRAMADAVDVHVFLLHPSPGAWDAVAGQLGPAAVGDQRPLRVDDPTAEVPLHPLVASWARDSRELQVVLGTDVEDHPLDPRPDGARGATLLRHIQDAIHADAPPDDAPPDADAPPEVDAGSGGRMVLDLYPSGRARDSSVQVHACHGQLRQVEVVRDVILGLLSDDPTLQPRDIVVMCPDVETYAPLVDAVFSADVRVDELLRTDDDPDLAEGLPEVRVRIADRSLRQVNPMLRTVADLLGLPDARVEASAILDLAHRAPVRRRFGLDERDLDTLAGWVDDLHVRWGIDADHREARGVPTDANTWRRSVDRLLVGAAVAPRGAELVHGVLPFDDVEGRSVDLAGRLAELVDRVAAVVAGLRDPRPVDAWCDDVAWATSLLADTSDEDAWQRLQVDATLDDLRDEAGAGADGDGAPRVPVTLAEFRGLLQDRLRGRPSWANHRTGDLTVCTLVPMRSVPFRVVCLLGLDDEVFPRRTVPNGADLIARAPAVGDRDPRTEDRQLLLDAMLAARDHLVVTYRGRDERSNAPLPPAVPVAELLDVVDATATTSDGSPARDAIVRHHALRAADARTFDPADPFGFDPIAHAGARAALAPPQPPPRFLDHLPAASGGPDEVELDDLRRFLLDPIDGYLRHRIGVRLRERDDARDDLLVLDPTGLDDWMVGTRLLEAELLGQSDAWIDAERGRGTLPPGEVGERWLTDMLDGVRGVAEVVRDELDLDLHAEPSTIEVDIEVDGMRIVGAVPDLRAPGLVRIDYGRPKPKRLFGLWLPWLALAAAGRPEAAWMITRGKKPAPKVKRPELARVTRLPGDLHTDGARDRLRVLVDLYRRGHDHPLLAFEQSSGDFAANRHSYNGRSTGLNKARNSWRWELQKPTVRRVLGDCTDEDLLAIRPLADESGDDWDDTEPSRFGRIAIRLWDPILADVDSGARK